MGCQSGNTGNDLSASNPHQLNVEHERGIGRDLVAAAVGTVREIRRDDQLPLLATCMPSNPSSHPRMTRPSPSVTGVGPS